METKCAYLGDVLHGIARNQCTFRDRGNEVCSSPCMDKVLIDDPSFLVKWKDPLVVIDRRRNMASEVLRDMLAGSSAFLVCGGPSATAEKMERLAERGCWSLAVNNVAGHSKWRPQAFVCSDPPSKFSHSIWLDPAIMKFVPTAKLGGRRARLRKKLPDGTFQNITDRTTSTCPNVWGFQRWSWLFPDDRFFLTAGACWGNHDDGSRKTGEPKVVCTMMIGLRLLRFLGARRIYLVGVDFKMRPDYGYSFAQARSEDACTSNNDHFRVTSGWMVKMQESGTFKRFGVEVFNTFQESGLRAFPYVPFEDAVREAKGIVEDVPNLSNWYDPVK